MPAQVILTGFTGHAIINGIQVLPTSGSISQDINPTYVNFEDIERDDISRSKVAYAPGTKSSSGSLAFDLTEDTAALFTADNLFQRNNNFEVKIFDGVHGKELDESYVTSISLSGSVGGLVTANVNFISRLAPIDYVPSGGIVYQSPISTLPLGYWFSGSTDFQVREWSFGFNQSTTLMYLNQISDDDDTLARYVKVGVLDFTLSMTTYDNPGITPDTISVATNAFTITGNTTQQGYSFGGATDIGTFTHDFTSAAVTLPTESLI